MAGGNRFWRWPGKGKDTSSSRQSNHSTTEHDEHESQATREAQQITPRPMRAPMGTPHFPTHPVPFSGATQVPETQLDSGEPYSHDDSPQSDRTRSMSASIPDSSAASHGASRSCQIDRRIHLTVDNGSLRPAHEVGQSFLPCFETKWFSEGWCWKKLTNQQHHFYFEEFKKRFYWDDGLDSVVYKIWYKKASKRYSDTLTKTRTGMMKKKMSNEIWAQWELAWQSEAFRKIREANSKNRRSEHTPGAGMSTHACGSRSIDDHKDDLARILGHEPDAYQLFVYTHSSKNEQGERVPCCRKAEDFGDEYGRLLEATTQQTAESGGEGTSEAPPIDPNKIYYEAVKGKSKKQRVYGVHTCASDYYPDSYTGTARTNHCGYDQETYERMRADLRRDIYQNVRDDVR